MLLDLARSLCLDPKKVGKKYKSACPACGGRSRFIIDLEKNFSWCSRRCGAQGDAIKLCRDYIGMTFHEARDRVGEGYISPITAIKRVAIEPIHFPTKLWVEKAEEFVASSHQRLLIDSIHLNYIQASRGLTIESIKHYRIGWNPTWSRQRRSAWGIAETERELWMPLPPGIVIPTFLEGRVSRIAIRKRDWKEGDKYGKYCQLPGNSDVMPMYGFWMNQVAVLVEAELDAMLLTQEIGEFCTCIALSGCTKKPDLILERWLHERSLILYALDDDEAGKKQYADWKKDFHQLRAWPANSRKSPADSHLLDRVNLGDWFKEGIEFWEREI